MGDSKTASEVSTHSRPKAADLLAEATYDQIVVSTHSRPKAAEHLFMPLPPKTSCFNTQPPEGG